MGLSDLLVESGNLRLDRLEKLDEDFHGFLHRLGKGCVAFGFCDQFLDPAYSLGGGDAELKKVGPAGN